MIEPTSFIWVLTVCSGLMGMNCQETAMPSFRSCQWAISHDAYVGPNGLKMCKIIPVNLMAPKHPESWRVTE